MEILGVGVPELMFIVLIALILLGPKDMIAAGRTFGKVLRQILTSPTWQAMRRAGEEFQQLPTRLAREAGFDDIQKEVQSVADSMKPLDFKKTLEDIQSFDNNKGLVLPGEPARSTPFSAPVTLQKVNAPTQPIEPQNPDIPKSQE